MAVSIHCNFCESARFRCKECTNFCCPDFCGRREDEERKEAMVPVSGHGPQQFGVFPTPFIDLKDWLPHQDAQRSILVIFRKRGDEVEILVYHEPHDPYERISMTADVEVKSDCEILMGTLAKDILAPHLQKPVERFMVDTLSGVFFQLHASFNLSNRIIQTFPIYDSAGHVVAGLMTVSPYNWESADLRQYAMPPAGVAPLDQMGKRSLRRSHRRP